MGGCGGAGQRGHGCGTAKATSAAVKMKIFTSYWGFTLTPVHLPAAGRRGLCRGQTSAHLEGEREASCGAILVPMGCSWAPGRAQGTGGIGAGTHKPPTPSGMSPVTRPVMLLAPL